MSEGLQRPLIRVGADRWGDAAGVLLRLRQDGLTAAVVDALEADPLFVDAEKIVPGRRQP